MRLPTKTQDTRTGNTNPNKAVRDECATGPDMSGLPVPFRSSAGDQAARGIRHVDAVRILLGGFVLAAGVMTVQAAAQSPPSDADHSRVHAVRIDETTVTGLWIGSTDGTGIELNTSEGSEIIPFDDLMSVSFPHEPLTSARAEPKSSDDPRGQEPIAHAPTVFYLADGGRLSGELVEPEGAPKAEDADKPFDALTARTPLGDDTVLPLDRLAGIQFADSEEHREAAKSFQDALSERLPGFDVLITRGTNDALEGNASPRSLRGRLERLRREQGSFAFGGRVRTFHVDKAFGIVLASGAIDQPTYSATVELKGRSVSASHGDSFSGEIRSATMDTLRMATSLGIDVDLPLSSIASIRFNSSRIVYVSDLSPAAQRVDGRLHRPWPIRLDRSVNGAALLLDGRRYSKGIGVHSRTELDYLLNGDFQTFVATIGIDDVVRPRGSVVFRVLGDGLQLYESPTVLGSGEPVTCRADVTGVDTMTLIVGYGDSLDLSDHADWAGARLIRPKPRTKGLSHTQ